MILSKKYKEQMDSVFMSEEVKNRILHNTINSDKQFVIKKNNKNRLYKRSMGTLVACLSILICINLRGFFLKIFGLENNKNTKNIEMKHNEDLNNNTEKTNADSKDLNKNTKKDTIKNESNSPSNVKNEDIKNNDKSNSPLIKNSDSKNNIIEIPEKEISEANESLNENIEKHDNNKETAKSKEVDTSENSSEKNDEISVASYDAELERSMLKEEASNIKQVNTIEDAENEVGFKFKTLKNIPEGFNIDNISVISNNTVKIDYKTAENELTFTIENNAENKPEEYTIYPFEKKININEISVAVKGYDNNLINESSWTDENASYSIYSPNGINENDLIDMIKSIN